MKNKQLKESGYSFSLMSRVFVFILVLGAGQSSYAGKEEGSAGAGAGHSVSGTSTACESAFAGAGAGVQGTGVRAELDVKKVAALGAAPAFHAYFQALNAELKEREYLLDLAQQALIAEEGVLIMGPPGNAKSMLADRVLGGIVDAKGERSYYRIQMTPETTLSETHGPISYKALQEEDQQVRKYEEGMLLSRNVFVDEIFDARANATRNILGMLAERAHSQGTRTVPGKIETFFAATNKYLSEVYEKAGDDAPRALIDRFSFTSFVPKDFESIGSELAIMRGSKAKRKTQSLAQSEDQASVHSKPTLRFDDLEKIRELVPEVELPDHVLLFLSVLIDRYGSEIENMEQSSQKAHDDKVRDGEPSAPPYRATKYMSARTMGKAAGILRSLVVKRWLESSEPKPELIANLDDVKKLESFYTLNGPNDRFVEALLGKTTNPHERAQLEAIQRERKLFRDQYQELMKSVDATVIPAVAKIHGDFHKVSHGTDAEKKAFAQGLADRVAALGPEPDLDTLHKAHITDQTIPHFMLREAFEATALELVPEREWEELLAEAQRRAPSPVASAVAAVGPVARIEAILKEFGGFILLPAKITPTGGAIAASGVSQKLWVEVMGNNPSKFKERKYCPDTYVEVTVDGKIIGMCPTLPMDKVAAESKGERDSDEEFIGSLNQIYEKAGLPTRFRRQTRAEYGFADTADGKEPKTDTQADLKDYTPYYEISNQASFAPSGERQPRSILNNKANTVGFRRSGNWEWADDRDGSDRALVGGGWCSNPVNAASGYRFALVPTLRHDRIGPSRLVRTQ